MPEDDAGLQDSNERESVPSWTLVTSHGLVLLYVASKPDVTLREMGADLELTERRLADIIRDLSNEGLLSVERKGRKNCYAVSPDARFRHPILSEIPFRAFIDLWRDFGPDRHRD